MASTYTLTETRKPSVTGDQKETYWDLNVTDYDPNTGVSLAVEELKLKTRVEELRVVATENNYGARWDGAETPAVITLYEAGADGAAFDELADTTDAGTFRVVAKGT